MSSLTYLLDRSSSVLSFACDFLIVFKVLILDVLYRLGLVAIFQNLVPFP